MLPPPSFFVAHLAPRGAGSVSLKRSSTAAEYSRNFHRRIMLSISPGNTLDAVRRMRTAPSLRKPYARPYRLHGRTPMKHVLTGEPISAVDRAWLEMDDPCNPMVISAVFQLEGPVDAARLQKTMVERLLRYPRFRQRVERVPGAPLWVDELSLDFSYHVVVKRMAPGAGERELRKAISAEVSREL